MNQDLARPGMRVDFGKNLTHVAEIFSNCYTIFIHSFIHSLLLVDCPYFSRSLPM